MMLNFLLSYGSTLVPLFISVRDSKVQSEQKDGNFEDMGKKKKGSFEEVIDDDGCSLLGEDINMVMKELGIEKHGLLGGEEVQKRWGYGEIATVFEEEVRMEEVTAAFDVFDRNKDGFIEAKELQRVLLALGLRQGVELKACRNMIRVFDHNRDGKIDFHEFVKLLF